MDEETDIERQRRKRESETGERQREIQDENSVLGRLSQRVSGVWRDFLRVIRLGHSLYKQRQASWQWFPWGRSLICPVAETL